MLNDEERDNELTLIEKKKARKRNAKTPEQRYEAAIEFLNDRSNPAAKLFIEAFHESVDRGKHFEPARQVVYITDELEEEYEPYEVRKFWTKYRIGSAAVLRLLREDYPASWDVSTIRACPIDFIGQMRKRRYGNVKTAETFESAVNYAD